MPMLVLNWVGSTSRETLTELPLLGLLALEASGDAELGPFLEPIDFSGEMLGQQG